MACLANVPAEILLRIISELYTPDLQIISEFYDDTESDYSDLALYVTREESDCEPATIRLASLSALSRTSNTFYDVAIPILYRLFIGSETANAKFLRTIVSRPDLAALTTNAVFEGQTANTRPGEFSHLDPDFLEESAVLVTAVTKSLGLPQNHPLMTGSNVLPGSKPGQQPAFEYCPVVTAILILYHLPKLRHLTFSSPIGFFALEETFDSWVFIESGCLTPPPPFFAELRTFSREDPFNEARTLLAPMLCPKIEEICSASSDMTKGWGVLGYLHGRQSSVKRISAMSCKWSGEGIGHLLDVASSLEDFEYHHVLHFVPMTVGAALQKVKDTLRRLAIVVDSEGHNFTHEEGWIGDLSRFSQLRILDLSANILMRESGAWLVDTLPPGVEDLTIRCDQKYWTAFYPLTLDILRRCRSLKSFRFSKLYYPGGPGLMVGDVQREALEKAGAAAGVVVMFSI